MIAALLLVATLARADEVATYDRLFGAEDAAPAESVERAELPSPWRLAGPAALAVIGLAGAYWLKKKGPAVTGARPLAVVWRQPLGDRGTLVLVEVLDADGETRRLLIGTGGGPPSLVADLGTCLSVEVYADMPAVSPEVASVSTVAAPKVAKGTPPKLALPTFATPTFAAASATLKPATPKPAKPAARPAPGLATYAVFAAAADAEAAVTSAVSPAALLSTPATARAEAARNVARELLAERRRIAC
jgi:hypothetical protein